MLAGVLLLQAFGDSTFPVPVPSEKMSRLFVVNTLFLTVLFLGELGGGLPAGAPGSAGRVTRRTAPRNSLGPPGTLWANQFPVMATSWAPGRAIPIPDSGGSPPSSSSMAAQALLLSLIRLPWMVNAPAGPGASPN